MRPLIAFLVLMLVIASGVLALHSCDIRQRNAAVARGDGADTSGILALPGGATIVAPPGSWAAGMVRYLASNETAPRSFQLNERQFDMWSGAPSPETEASFVTLTALLKAWPDAHATIIGHTDNIGTAGQNQALSEARAIAVVDALVAHGIEARRLTATGRGLTAPIVSNESDQGRARNRRIEIELHRAPAER